MRSQTTIVPAEKLEIIHKLYRQGKYLQAYEYSKEFGPFESWQGTEELMLAGRLASHLGARSLTRRLHHRAYHRDPTHPEAQYYFGWGVLEMRGPLAAWKWLKQFGDIEGAKPEIRADLLALQARTAFLLRDFETAEELLARAEALHPDHAWLAVERCSLLEAKDRYEEALQAALRSTANDRWYRPGVHCIVHILQLLNRDEEAMALLTESLQHVEGTTLSTELAQFQIELKRYPEAKQTLEHCRTQAPLADKRFNQWLYANRADVEYFCGNFAAAAEFAKEVEGKFYKSFAERLQAAQPGGTRVELPVGFVRQHHMTCAPATLSAITRYWGKETEHVTLAETICYDGTPAHSERSWGERNGFLVREFKVTQSSAEALLKRGVPFTLTTVDPGNAHLQAVIGFDEMRKCLIVRDPYQRHTHEFDSEKALEYYASSGPRGMVLVPCEKVALLEGIELPEVELYDALHRLNGALEVHDRVTALREFDRLKKSAPDHRMTLQAQRTLAYYDSNSTEQLAAIEKLLQQFPKDANLQLSRLGCLRDLTTREKRVEVLKEVCADKKSDPLIWRDYAHELSLDGREYASAMRWLKRIGRFRPMDSHAIYQQANLLWNQRQFAEATELYRFAASLDDKKEYLASAYFNASRYLKQTDKTIAFLKERFQRLGKLSHLPATTLFWAYSELCRTNDAFNVLESALTLRPEDGDLLLYAADAYARYQNMERARALLNKAETRAQRSSWLRSAATIADYAGDLKAALGMWREVLALEPLALDANRSVAQLTAETEGRAAALRLLQEVCDRFPHHFALHTVWLDWLRSDGDAVTEPVLRRLVAVDPINAWARRELALALGRLEKFDEAFAEAELALKLDPSDCAGYNVRGWLYLHQGEREKAKQDLRQSISLAVDFGSAIHDLLEACGSLQERKDAIAFVEQELIRQVVFGDGLLSFRNAARPLLSPDELLAALQKALAARPDLWHAWSAVINQLTDMQRHDEGLKVAGEATERFPLLPRLWLDLARVHRARLDGKNEVAATEKAVQLAPSWGYAVRQLAEAHERLGDMQSARSVLEAHLIRVPLDEYSHGFLADALWKLGEKAAALSRLQHTLKLNSEYDWAWNTVDQWARDLKQPQLPEQMARELTTSRPGKAHNWLVLARTIDADKNPEEALASVDRALQLSPRNIDAWDFKVLLLVGAGRFADALQACRPPVFANRVPTVLRAREAWVYMRQAQMGEAIRLMKAVVTEDPSHYWGWKQLADWYWETGSYKEAVEAASQLSRLAPFDPLPLGYSGDMKMRLEDHAGAKADFERAMKLAPTYTYAGYSLFDLQMDDGETDAAAETLRFLKQHLNNDEVTAREIRLHCFHNRWKEAAAALDSLCMSHTEEDWALRSAIFHFSQGDRALKAEALLEKHLKNELANPNVGAAWVNARMARVNWFFWSGVDKQFAPGEIHRRALVRYIEKIAEKYSEVINSENIGVFQLAIYRFLLTRVLRKHRELLHGDDWSWGKVGYALTTQKRMKDVVDWLGDWKNRKKVEGWMIYNLALALRHTKRELEAISVCQHGLTLPFDNGIHPVLSVWLAFEEALAGNTESAINHLGAVNVENVTEGVQWIERFTRGMIEVQKAAPAERLDAFKEALKRFKETGSIRHAKRITRRCYWRSIKRMRADCDSVQPLLRGAFNQYGYFLVSFPLTIVSAGLAVVHPQFISVAIGLGVFSLSYYIAKK